VYWFLHDHLRGSVKTNTLPPQESVSQSVSHHGRGQLGIKPLERRAVTSPGVVTRLTLLARPGALVPVVPVDIQSTLEVLQLTIS